MPHALILVKSHIHQPPHFFLLPVTATMTGQFHHLWVAHYVTTWADAQLILGRDWRNPLFDMTRFEIAVSCHLYHL
jgi:hypothetical protein